jgi:chemotaxis protein CheX
MEPDLRRESSKQVHLILSAKSSGRPVSSSKLTGLPREEIRQKLAADLESAAREVFEMMVGRPLGPAGEATLPRVPDYTSMIGLAGDLCGVMSLRCSSTTATRIATLMLSSNDRVPEDCIRDALGEICNMVAGSFKAQVMGLADQCMLSVPMVVSGKDYQLYPLADGERIQISSSFEGALLWITLDLHS